MSDCTDSFAYNVSEGFYGPEDEYADLPEFCRICADVADCPVGYELERCEYRED